MKQMLLTLALTLVAVVAQGDEPTQPSTKTTGGTSEIPIPKPEELVTTPSKHPELRWKVPAAIYVITQEDIRRSGAASIPELLRMVPGMQVAQLDANIWAISTRGFHTRFANKMLVLMDGRSVYSPLFSGVFWDAQDTLLEDIERIEVIRGPGGALWGANAVNGIVNIITKNAELTQGTLLTAGVGNEERGFGSFRCGGTMSKGGFYRVFAKYFTRDDFVDFTGARSADGWDVRRGGFRVDKDMSVSDTLMVQGDFYKEHFGQRSTFPLLTPPFAQTVDSRHPASGFDLLARWEHQGASGSNTAIQMYFDHTDREAPEGAEVRNTLDIDVQRQLAPRGRHSVIYGLGYRRSADRTAPNAFISFDPPRRTIHLFSAFVHDEISLKENLSLSLGAKFERNSFSGFEAQPSIRLAWTPDSRRTLWAAVSRAVRTPSRADHDVRINVQAFPDANGIPNLLAILGNDRFQSEKVLAYELGYRFPLGNRFLIDIATFYNEYQHLLTDEPDTPFLENSPAPPHIVVPLRFDNKQRGHTYGFEVDGDYTVTRRWRLSFGYALLHSRLHLDPTSQDTSPNPVYSPRHQFHVRSYLDLSKRLRLDVLFYDVGKIGTPPPVPAYSRFDVRLGWQPKDNLEISLVGQNVFRSQHQEFVTDLFEVPSLVQRSIYGKMTWKF